MKSPAIALSSTSTLLRVLDEQLDARLDDAVPAHLWEQALVAPLHELLRRNGKGFRGRLVERAWLIAGGERHRMPAELPCVVELLHAGSLVVDDIEDDSDLRRGAPTLHRIYGTPIALNTGNSLYFMPLVLIGSLGLPAETTLALHQQVSVALLASHRGQALDLGTRMADLAQGEVGHVVAASSRLRTGSLMGLAASLGATACGGSTWAIESLRRFGSRLGVGLQMLDDLGGILDPARRAKGEEDLRFARSTWPWAWLAEELDPFSFTELVRQQRAVSAGADPGPLLGELRSLLGTSARQRVRAHLDDSLACLEQDVGCSTHLADLAREIACLETSYG